MWTGASHCLDGFNCKPHIEVVRHAFLISRRRRILQSTSLVIAAASTLLGWHIRTRRDLLKSHIHLISSTLISGKKPSDFKRAALVLIHLGALDCHTHPSTEDADKQPASMPKAYSRSHLLELIPSRSKHLVERRFALFLNIQESACMSFSC